MYKKIENILSSRLFSAKGPKNRLFLFFLFSWTFILGGYLFSYVLAAGDTSFDWDFSTPGDYTLSDANLLEIVSSQVQLKVLNYENDADTVLLYHLDENTGTAITDSSSNNNLGSASDITWNSGNLSYALQFNGINSKIAVSDSSSLSFSGSNTLEGWVNFTNNFSAGSHGTKQYIFDKGDYQLYFDNETGKLVYELSSTDTIDWTQRGGSDISGSWDTDGKITMEAITVIGSTVYAGLGSGNGDAEVWAWDGNSWELIGGDAVNSSWALATFESVYSMETDGTDLYVGLGVTAGDGEVWKYTVSSGTWSKIGGDGINSGWTTNTYERVSSLEYFDGGLYAGLGASANDAEVWMWNGNTWTKIGGDSANSGWATNFELVSSLESDGTYLYAGLAASAGDAEVWAWDGISWTRIGGDGVSSSWVNSTYEYVYSLKTIGSDLYVGLGTSANDAEVWLWSGSTWSQVGGDSLNSGWTTNYEGVYSLETDGTYLFAGLGATGGDNELWQFDPNTTTWTKLGGDGVNSGYTGTTHTIVESLAYDSGVLYTGLNSGNAARSAQLWTFESGAWSQIGGDYINNSWGFRGLRSVESMAVAGDKLYAGLGTTNSGNALVWEYDESDWTLIGGQGKNNGWSADTYEGVFSSVSYKGELYVGLGASINDSEVWHWNGTTWNQVGGDSLNSGWTVNYEEVSSLASDETYLYAGLGSGNGDGEVWQYDGTQWEKIGGDNINSGWNTGYNRVSALQPYNGKIYAGLGSGTGEAELWEWDGSVWVKVGGDGLDSSWANTTFEQVTSMTVFNGKLYVGLGTGSGDADLWEWDGSTWSQIGGDDIGGSWTSGTYERVRAFAGYNGNLYVGLGNGTGDGEIWTWNGSTWNQVGGDSINSGWTNVVDEVVSMAVYRGKLYVGNGNSQNVDAAVWSTGNNLLLESSTSAFSTGWTHVAATYNGSSMKIFVDGIEDSSRSASLIIPDSSNDLIIGTGYSGREIGKGESVFEGQLDELRISSIARTSFTTTPYASDPQTVQNSTAVFTEDVATFAGFVTNETPNGGNITYRLSSDGGTTWEYWDGDSWETSSGLSESNSAADVNTNINSFSVSQGGIIWQAVLDGDGDQQVILNSVSVEANSDTDDPSPPNSVVALNQSGGSTFLTSDVWYGYTTPNFAWSGASDSGAGVAGYFVYFGTDNTAVPSTAGVFQESAEFSASGLVSGQTYYLRIQTKDGAQNVSPIYAAFIYKFDNTAPGNPSTITVTPSGYAASNSFTFSWPGTGVGIASDLGSGIAGYQYKTGAESGPLSDWSTTTTDTSVTIPDAAYQTDANTFYLRVLDNAGNVSTVPLQATYYFAGSGPSVPQFLGVNPSTNTDNSFSFSWQPPSTYSGTEESLTYCYSVNTLPSSSTCTFTSPGVTALSAGAFATQVGINTFYLVAKTGEEYGGAINYGAYSTVTFTANTSAPGIPLNLEISDVSIKSTESWRLALSWTPPTNVGSGVDYYEIYSSIDGSDFTSLATTTGSAYIDTNLLQEVHYYKVRACDNVSNCGEFSTEVSLLPTGRFTEAATLESDPEVKGITTKRATISWSTDRVSDSKVQYGTGSNSYFDEEPSNSTQVTAHEITLSNLSPGTKYYALAKWTDEDGNTGVSDEFTFETEPAPTVTDPSTKFVGIDRVTLEYTLEGASSAKIYYGLSSSFGAVIDLATSTAKTTYSTTVEELLDGTKYFYKINTLDAEGDEYEGNILSFETLPRPKIENVRIQQVRNSAQPSILVTWTSNTEVSSIVTYYPLGDPSNARDEVNVELTSGEHQMIVKGLLPETTYALQVKGRDKSGNEATSDIQRVTTATDTRPPLITDLTIEGTVTRSQDQEAAAQLVVSWNTDEPSTSQVEFGEGTGTTYSQKSQEDNNLTYNHVVLITGLNPSKVYHLRALSTDKAGNLGNSVDTVTITPKASDNALNLVITNLSKIFGFLSDISIN